MADELYDPDKHGPIVAASAADELYDPAKHGPLVPAAAAPDLSAIPGLALKNAPRDAGQMLEGVGHMIAHPLNTAAGVAGMVTPEIVSGGMRYAAHKVADQLPEGTAKRWINELSDIQANAPAGLRQYVTERYGGWDNLKRSLAEHPVQTATDLASVLTGGEGALASSMPRTAQAIGTVGRAIDPIRNVQRIAGGAADLVGGVAKYPVSISSGLSPKGQSLIAENAQAGNPAAFNAMRGGGKDSVAMAQDAVQQAAAARQQAYLANKAEWGADLQQLDHQPILDALDAAVSKTRTPAGFIVDPRAHAATKEMRAIIEDHMTTPGQDFGAIGMDQLKQRLGVVREATDHTTLSRNVANQIYDAARKHIADNAPKYAAAMEDYAKASDQLKEFNKSLSLNPNASRGTTLGKLQTMLRNDVSSNYGQRAKLGEILAKYQPDLLPTLAGEMARSWVPRTMVGRMGEGAMSGGAIASAISAPHLLPALGLGIAASTPRVVGEVIHGVNRAREPIAAASRYAARVQGLLGPMENRRGLLDE